MPRRRSRNRRLGQETAPPPPASAPTSSSTAETPPDGRGRVGGCLHCVWKGLKKWAALSVGRRTSSAAPRAAADRATGPAAPKRAAADPATGPAAPKKRRPTHHAWKYVDTARKEEEPEEEGDDEPQDEEGGDEPQDDDQHQQQQQLEGGQEPQQLEMDQDLDNPYQNKRKYKEFVDARAKFSKKFEICHLCFFEGAPRFPWDGVILRKEIITHVYTNHGVCGVACLENGCAVRFRTKEHRLLHAQYCQELLEDYPELQQLTRFCRGG